MAFCQLIKKFSISGYKEADLCINKYRCKELEKIVQFFTNILILIELIPLNLRGLRK